MKATLKENKEKIVSVSELNNGGVGKIFLDLQKNNSEYIILKNDRPAAVLLPLLSDAQGLPLSESPFRHAAAGGGRCGRGTPDPIPASLPHTRTACVSAAC